MSNTTGPQTWQAAANAAQQSQNLPSGGSTNTTGWSWQAKETFYGNGGR